MFLFFNVGPTNVGHLSDHHLWSIKPRNCGLKYTQTKYGVYSNHLNTEQVWYSNGPKVSDCRMVRILNSGLKTGQ